MDDQGYEAVKKEVQSVAEFFDRLTKKSKSAKNRNEIRTMKILSLDGIVMKYSCFFDFVEDEENKTMDEMEHTDELKPTTDVIKKMLASRGAE